MPEIKREPHWCYNTHQNNKQFHYKRQIARYTLICRKFLYVRGANYKCLDPKI
jgi:hypothetical protein